MGKSWLWWVLSFILSWESFKLGTNLNSDFRPGAANFSPELKQTKLKVLSRSECEAQWGESYNHDIQICTAPSDTHVYIVNISQLFFIPFFLFVSIHFRIFCRETVVVRCCGRNTRRFRALINSIGTRFTATRQVLSVSQLEELFSAEAWDLIGATVQLEICWCAIKAQYSPEYKLSSTTDGSHPTWFKNNHFFRKFYPNHGVGVPRLLSWVIQLCN